MPVNKHIGRLWFDTQEEIDRYDDLVVSNIELKEGENMDDPNYTFISPRARKEIMPGFSEKAKLEVQRYLNFEPNPRQKHSFSRFYEWPMLKYGLGMAAGYLVIRELPIRSFYARAIIMTVYALTLREQFQWRGFRRAIEGSLVVNYDPDYLCA